MIASREALNAAGMTLPLFTGGMTRAGINLSGTWVGTVRFEGSYDGVNWQSLSVTPFASGTAVTSSTANGSWFVNVDSRLAVRVNFYARTSGTVIATVGASVDSSYQESFLASTSVYVNQEVTGGATNVITQAAQANRAWRLKSLSVGFSVAAAAAVKLTISDGASSVLWAGYVPKDAGSAITNGGTWEVPLPKGVPSPGTGIEDAGVVGTAGNMLVVTLAGPGGSVVSELNAVFIPA